MVWYLLGSLSLCLDLLSMGELLMGFDRFVYLWTLIVMCIRFSWLGVWSGGMSALMGNVDYLIFNIHTGTAICGIMAGQSHLEVGMLEKIDVSTLKTPRFPSNLLYAMTRKKASDIPQRRLTYYFK